MGWRGADNEIDDDGAKYIAQILERSTTITEINMFSTRAMWHRVQLAVRDMMGNGIRASGAECIAHALEKNTTLKTLDMRSLWRRPWCQMMCEMRGLDVV